MNATDRTTVPPPTSQGARPAPYRMLDAWRGVASLAVVAFHWSEIAVHNNPELSQQPLYSFAGFGWLGVQIFFVISGFCIVASAAGLLGKGEAQAASKGYPLSSAQLLKVYLTARARRIYPTYWAGLALVLLFSWAATQMARAGRIPDNIYTHFDAAHLPLPAIITNIALLAVPLHQGLFLTVAWTLCYEVAFYGIIGVALGVAAWTSGTKRAAGNSVGTLLNLLHGVTLGSLLWLCVAPSQVIFPLELWPQFGLGILLYDLLMVVNPARKRVAVLAFGGTLFLILVLVVFHNANVGAMGQPIRLAFPTSGAFTLFLLATYRYDSALMNKNWARCLGFVGLFSYSLYLTHTVTIRVAGQLLQRTHLFPRFHIFVFVLVTAISVAAAYLFFLMFEKPLLARRKIQQEPVP